jgi:hypothetical protein
MNCEGVRKKAAKPRRDQSEATPRHVLLYFFLAIDGSFCVPTSTIPLTLAMSIDLAKLENHLAIRSYIEG